MKHRPFVFIDVETTGSSPWNSRVLEIGAVRVEDNRIVKTMKQLVNPEESVPYWITRITGIRDEDVWEQPVFKAVANELEKMFEDALFIAHNVDFDYGFIRQEFQRLGVKFHKDRMCTVRLSRALYPRERSHRLDAVIQRHGYKVANRHRALDDAQVLFKFYTEHFEKHGNELYRIMDRLVQKAPKLAAPGVPGAQLEL